MNHQEFTAALLRLNRHKIGLTEACTLFTIADQTRTAAEVAEAVGEPSKDLVKARIGILRNKRLAESVYGRRGAVSYRATSHGRTVISQTLKTGKNEN